MHLTTSERSPRSRPAKAYSDNVFGIGVTAARIVAGSAPRLTAIGEPLAGMLGAERLVIRRAAAVREPAHDDLVAADDLLAVDAEILPVVRAARASS